MAKILMKIFEWIPNKTNDPSSPSMRVVLLNANLKIGLGVGTLLFILLVIQDIQKELFTTLAISSFIYIWLVAITFIHRIPYRVRAISWLAVLYLPAVIGLYINGLGADISMYLLLFVLMTTMFFGFRWGLAAIALCALTIIITGSLILDGIVIPQIVRPQTDFVLWLIGLLTLVVMSLFVFISTVVQREYLRKSRNEYAQATRDLNQAFEEITKREEYFRSMIEYSTDLILILGAEGKCSYASPSVRSLLGYAPGELIGKDLSNFLHPEDQPGLHEFISQGTWPEQVISMEMRFRHADTSWRILEIRGRKAVLDGGEPHLIFNCRDITDQKQAGEALSAADQLKQKAFANLNDAIFIIEPELNTIFDCNQAACQIFGYTREELLGSTTEILHVNPENRKKFKAHMFSNLDQEGGMSHFEFQMKRKDGTIFPSEQSIIPLKDLKGTTTGWVSIVQDITTRKLAEKINIWELEQQKQQAEVALMQSESKLQHLFAGMMDAFFSTDMEGNIQDFNQVFSKMLGYQPEELKGKTRLSLLTEKWHSLEKQVIKEEVLERGYSEVHEKEMVRRNGEVFPVEIRTFTYTNERGERAGMWSIVRDISRRKGFESQLHRSEEMYRTLAEASRDMIFIIDNQDRVQYVNSFAASTYGLKPEDMVGQPRSKFFGSTDGQRQEASIRKVLQTGQPHYVETQTIFPRGRIWLSTWLVPLKNPQGVITGMLGVSRDITEWKMIEQKLQRSEEMYRTLAEAAQDVIYIISEQDRVLYVNTIGASIFKAKPDEIIGQPWTRYFDPSTHKMQKENLHKVFTSKQPLYVETVNQFPSGPVWLSTWLVPLQNEAGEINGILGVSRDISERNQIEEKLSAAQHNLEETVSRRTRQLETSQERLRALSRKIITAQEDERHIISRELHDEAGQSLMSLKFSLDAMKNGLTPDQAAIQEKLAEMVTDIDQLMVQIRDLSHRLRPPLLDLGGINLCLKELCWEFQKDTGLEVEYTGEDILDLPDDIGISLYRLVQEALVNVQKHSRADCVEVIFRYNRGTISVTIEDNGQGLTRKEKKGIGLLGIEERLKLLGGTMKLLSREGRGLRLVASIPWSGTTQVGTKV